MRGSSSEARSLQRSFVKRSLASPMTALVASRIGLRRPVVARERDGARRRREQRRVVEDVAHGRAAEGVDRLRVVADGREAAAVRLQREQDGRLQAVRVLVLVDQHVAEALPHVAGQRGLVHQLRPVEQQVVVVEHALALLRLHVGREEPAQLRLPRRAPREVVRQHAIEARLLVHRGRVDREARSLQREALAALVEPQLGAHEVHQVGRVLAIEDREGRVHAAALGVLAQQPRADAVEGPGPRQHRVRHARPLFAQPGHDAFDAPRHLHRGAAREGQQQDRARIDAARHEAGDAMRQRVGLARAGAGDDQQRSAIGAVEPVTRRGALLGVEAREEAVDAGGGWFGDGTRGERGSGHGGDGRRL